MSKSFKIVTGSMIAAVLLVAAVAMFDSANQSEAQPAVVRVGYRSHDLYLPLFVGIENNYFADEGLVIEPVKFESTNQLMDAMLAGNLDAALGGINSFTLFNIQQASPGEVKVFSVVNETSDVPFSYLLVKEDSPVQSISELRGKKIGAYPGSTVRILYKKTVAGYFDPSEAELVQMEAGLGLSALESGQIDAVIVLEPLKTIAKARSLARALDGALFDKYILKDLPLATSVLSSRFVNNDPDVAKRFIRASERSFDFINERPDEAKQLLPDFTPLDTELAQHITLPHFLKLKEIDRGSMQDLADVLYESGELEQKLNTSEMFLKEGF